MKYQMQTVFVAIAALALLQPPTPAQQGSLEQRVSNLERRVANLERRFDAASPRPETPPVTRNWRDKANWRKLQVGMTASQVRALMGGDPHRIVRISGELEIWYYDYPLGGSLNLRNGRVESWSEP